MKRERKRERVCVKGCSFLLLLSHINEITALYTVLDFALFTYHIISFFHCQHIWSQSFEVHIVLLCTAVL